MQRRPDNTAKSFFTVPEPPRLRLAASACLLGQAVRFDAGHKASRFVLDTLAELADLVPFCPEVELGLGTPREAVHLVRGDDGTVRLVGVRSRSDHTEAMLQLAGVRVAELAGMKLDGVIVKSRSPSCGLERVKMRDANGVPSSTEQGLFTRVLTETLPLLPVEEEGRLHDPDLRDAFLTRIYAYQRLKGLDDASAQASDLVQRHAAEKYLLMAFHPSLQKQLGRIVARAGSTDLALAASWYRAGFMKAISGTAPRRRHTNVLQHMAGYVSDRIAPGDRRELTDAIDDFHHARAPRWVPLTLLRHHIRREEVDYLAAQTYLAPYPLALAGVALG